MIATLPANSAGNRPVKKDKYGNEYVLVPSTGEWIPAENTSVYVGYNSNSGPNVNINGINLSQNGLTYTETTENYVHPTNKPIAYTANAAKTASSIKQGGMTKDEIMDFNIRHPNETMIRGQ